MYSYAKTIIPFAISDNKDIKLYNDTKHKIPFAQPLNTNGINQLSILNNTKCQKPTFNFTRYAAEPLNNKNNWVNNPIYNSDISLETIELKNNYMDTIYNRDRNITMSIIEDMYYLTNEQAGNTAILQYGNIRKMEKIDFYNKNDFLFAYK